MGRGVRPTLGKECIVSGASSLPPLKKNDGKYAVIALLILLAAGGLWFFLRGDDPEPPASVEVTTPPPAEAETVEEVTAEIEIPPDEMLEPDAAGGNQGDAPRRQPSNASPESWACNGTINPAEARAVIQGSASKQVQTCYERGLRNNNLLQGSMDVQLTIDVNGEVRAVSIGGDVHDPQVHSCVRRVAKTWKFSQPTGGCVRINVPFQLTPKL